MQIYSMPNTNQIKKPFSALKQNVIASIALRVP